MSKQTDFIKQFENMVIEACSGTGILPSVKMAQLILETGWGTSIKKAGNNLFGIKAGRSWNGPVISNTTREVISGTSKYFTGTGKIYPNKDAALRDGADPVTLFRAYKNVGESIKDHTQLLVAGKNFRPVVNSSTPEAQAQALQSVGYATDPNYASVLMSLINKYNLRDLDKKKSL